MAAPVKHTYSKNKYYAPVVPLAILLSPILTFEPTVLTAAIHTTAIRATRSAYSTKLAARSFFLTNITISPNKLNLKWQLTVYGLPFFKQ